MKALCSERFLDWGNKFESLGINCLEITGDSELEDFAEVFNANLICTTPEKWDSMSRRWKDNKKLFQQIQLFLIDEIHVLNDPNRGATVEAVVSRMKTLEMAQELENTSHIRFVAVSATMPNYKDFCSSRKSVVQSAEALAGDLRNNSLLIHFSAEILHAAAKSVHEHKLSELLHRGIGIHHAGLDINDRRTVEDLFKTSQLPVLVSTSTLAMGVNLPAHLVVIKSTHFYNMGVVQEYSNMQVLQMIGRAGRPQLTKKNLASLGKEKAVISNNAVRGWFEDLRSCCDATTLSS
ncbi:helicase [Plakobranchus ocellatus]|uniref:Helicase n=1 Tax=Plakobranchus ocellatus TaxID=259542 RepID=A0AAV3Y2D6_9GAST|nr:helicase [Plakobranchus ocellatus]